MLLSSTSALLVTGVTGTALKVLQGEDPSLTDAFLLAAGVGVPLPFFPAKTLGQTLSGQPGTVSSVPVPSKPPLQWGPLAGPEKVDSVESSSATLLAHDAHTSPLALSPDSPLLAEVQKKLTPPLREQVANGEEVVVLSTKITDVRQRVVDGKTITTLAACQQVADASELRLENIMNLISRCNRGESISVSDVFVAVVKDLFDQPIQILKHISNPTQIYAALRGTRAVSVDIISTSINHEYYKKLGFLTQKKEFNQQVPGVEVQIDAELTHSTEQNIYSQLELHQIQYHWDSVVFEQYVPTASDATLAAGQSTKSHIKETMRTETIQALQATGGTTITGDSTFDTATSMERRTIVDNVVKEYTLEGSALDAVADGRLTEGELAATQAQLEQSEHWRSAHAEELTAPSPQAQSLGADTANVEAAKPEVLSTLKQLLEQMKAGQPVSLETGVEFANQVRTARQRAGGLVDNPNIQITSYHEEQEPVISQTASSEHTDNEGWISADKTKTQTNTTDKKIYDSQISTEQFIMKTEYGGNGLYTEGRQLPETHVERASVHTVEAKQTQRREVSTEAIKSKTLFGLDTEKFLGHDKSTSETHYTDTTRPTTTTYRIMDHDTSNAIADGRLTANELSEYQAKIIYKKTGAMTIKNFADPSTAHREFQSGWVEYIPLGSVASCGMKSSFGHELVASDYFWAVADGVLMTATLGAGAIGGAAIKGVGKSLLKGQIKQAGKELVTHGGKTLTTVGTNLINDVKAPFIAAKQSLNYTIKHGPVEAAKEMGHQAVDYGKQIYNVATGKNKFDVDALHGISSQSRKPLNAQYAASKMPASQFNNEALRSRYPSGVDFTKNGYPNFNPHAQASVDINMTGNNAIDFSRANKAAGFEKTPKGFTWHHNQNGRIMELVPTDLHQAVRHTGGASLARAQTSAVEQGVRFVAAGTNVGSKVLKENMQSDF